MQHQRPHRRGLPRQVPQQSLSDADDCRASPLRNHQNHAPRSRGKERNPMQIQRAGTNPSGKGPADWFTGTVRVDPLFRRPTQRACGASVTFEPGARTAWHTHPLGQTLVVTCGCGWAQSKGPRRGNSPWRRGLVRARREALARRDSNDRYDAYRDPGTARRQNGRLAGARQRRPI